jgi:hypothetical protein
LNGVTIPNAAGQVVWPRPPVSPAPPTTLYYFPAGLAMTAIYTGDSLGPLVMDTAASTVRSDIITVMYVDRTLPTLPTDSVTVSATGTTVVVHYNPATPSNLGVQINTTAANTIAAGDLFIFTNANGTTVQEVTSSPANSQTLQFNTTDVQKFNQPTLAAGNGGIKTLVPTPTGYPPVTLQRMYMVTYYIDRSTATLPQLMRRVGANAPVAIATGVENMQISYDDWETGATSLVNYNTPPNNNAIRKINVYLGGRSEEKSRQTKDYVRNSMQTQITVRSLGLFDRYPGT